MFQENIILSNCNNVGKHKGKWERALKTKRLLKRDWQLLKRSIYKSWTSTSNHLIVNANNWFSGFQKLLSRGSLHRKLIALYGSNRLPTRTASLNVAGRASGWSALSGAPNAPGCTRCRWGRGVEHGARSGSCVSWIRWHGCCWRCARCATVFGMCLNKKMFLITF